MTDAISSEGANSSVVIWNGTVMRTDARPCCEGESWTGAVSELGTTCNPATANDAKPPGGGLCCCDGTIRILPSAPAAGCTFAISDLTCEFRAYCGCRVDGNRIDTSLDMGPPVR